MHSRPKARLILENGVVFNGVALGCTGTTVGEVVFNTAMTGYQEILSDPSYAEQIVTLTYPHIGNVGVNKSDNESSRCYLNGLVIRDYPETYHNWRAEQSLDDYLKAEKIIAIAEIDTRALTSILRDEGAMRAMITTEYNETEFATLQTQIKNFAPLQAEALAKLVSSDTVYEFNDTHPAAAHLTPPVSEKKIYHVVVYDYGVKRNILRELTYRACRVTVVPATTTAKEVQALNPDGIVLSNGPGDPAQCIFAIKTIQNLLNTDIPIFGICLGHQLLALAMGANTFKMKFGHHGANHPVQAIDSGKVYITSQNHGYAVKDDTYPKSLRVTHRSLFDNSIQGLKHTHKPIFSFQGHPEASPGPHDLAELFDEFIGLMS